MPRANCARRCQLRLSLHDRPGEFNQICGDWAGYAQEFLERDHPGAIVLTPVGSVPTQTHFHVPASTLPATRAGIATEVNRLLANPLTPFAANSNAAANN